MNNPINRDTIKELKEGLKGIIWVGQLGFSLVTPPILLSLFAWWLKKRLGLSGWVIIAAVIIGLVTGASTAVSYYADYKRKEAQEEKRPAAFSEHR